MKCSTCQYRHKCSIATDRYAVCFAQGKPWEPQDNERTAQMPDGWWDKQMAGVVINGFKQ